MASGTATKLPTFRLCPDPMTAIFCRCMGCKEKAINRGPPCRRGCRLFRSGYVRKNALDQSELVGNRVPALMRACTTMRQFRLRPVGGRIMHDGAAQSDEALLIAIAAGDWSAFAAFFQRLCRQGEGVPSVCARGRWRKIWRRTPWSRENARRRSIAPALGVNLDVRDQKRNVWI